MGEQRVAGEGRVRKMEGSREDWLIRGTAAKAVEWKRTVLQNFPGPPLQVTDISHSSQLLRVCLKPN